MKSIYIVHPDNFIEVQDARNIVALFIGDGQTSPSI